MNLMHAKLPWSTLASTPGILFVYSPLLIGLTLIGVAIPFATGRFIDSLAYNQPFRTPLILLSSLLLIKTLLSPVLQRYICTRSRTYEIDLQFRVLNATINLPPSRIIPAANGELVAKLTRDTYAIGGFVHSIYPRILQSSVMMFAAGVALYSRSAILCISFIAFIPLTIFLFAPFAQQFYKNSHAVRRQSDSSFCTLFDFLQSLSFLRILNAERQFVNEPQAALKGLKGCNEATDAISIQFGFFIGILMVVGEISVLIIAGPLAAKGFIPVGDVVLYQMLFISAIQSIQNVIGLLPEFSALRESVDSLNEALEDMPSENGHEHLGKFENLTFNHVTFAYPHTTGDPVIKDFSAVFSSDSVVGIFGVNGSGKSTLLKLAVGALEPQEGEIRVNGRPLSTIDPALFRRSIGIVFQDNLIVTGTVKDNITLRDPAFTPEDIEKALTLSGFDTVVKRLPNGLDTFIGGRVRTLSGGERQRLAIARAIIRNPAILILDEATNHLDAESHKDIDELIIRLRPGRLILLAGHDTELDNLCDAKISCQI